MIGRKILGQLLVSVLVTTLLLPGCLEEIGDLNSIAPFRWNPEFGTPLIDSRFNFVDFLTNDETESIVEIDDEGLITLRWSENVLTRSASSIFDLPDQSYQNLISAQGSDLTPTPITTTLDLTREFVQTFRNDDKLDSLQIKQGTLRISIESNFKADGEYRIIIPSLIKNGVPFEKSLSTVFSGSMTNQSSSNEADLQGYTMDLSQGGTNSNSFKYVVQAQLQFNNQPITSSDRILASIRLSELLFSGLFGKLNQKAFDTNPDTLLIDIMNNLGEKNPAFDFENPSVRLNLKSSYGLDIKLVLSSLTTRNVNGEVKHLSGEIIEDPPTLIGPGLNEVGKTIETEIILGKQNSNVSELFSSGPNMLTYKLEGILNPDNEDRVFVLDSSSINLDLGVRLPLFGKVSNLALANDFEFDGGDLEDVKRLIFKSETLNGFPMEISLQAYLLDQGGVVLDSIFSQPTNLLSAGMVNENGVVIESEPATFEVEMEDERVQNLEAAAKIRIVATLNTRNNQSAVKFLNTYFVDIRIGIQAEYDVEI